MIGGGDEPGEGDRGAAQWPLLPPAHVAVLHRRSPLAGRVSARSRTRRAAASGRPASAPPSGRPPAPEAGEGARTPRAAAEGVGSARERAPEARPAPEHRPRSRRRWRYGAVVRAGRDPARVPGASCRRLGRRSAGGRPWSGRRRRLRAIEASRSTVAGAREGRPTSAGSGGGSGGASRPGSSAIAAMAASAAGDRPPEAGPANPAQGMPSPADNPGAGGRAPPAIVGGRFERLPTPEYELVLMLDPEVPDERRDQIAADARAADRVGGQPQERQRLGHAQARLRDPPADRGRLPVLPLRDRRLAARRPQPQPEDRRRRAPLPDLQGRPPQPGDRAAAADPAARPGAAGPRRPPRRRARRAAATGLATDRRATTVQPRLRPRARPLRRSPRPRPPRRPPSPPPEPAAERRDRGAAPSPATPSPRADAEPGTTADGRRRPRPGAAISAIRRQGGENAPIRCLDCETEQIIRGKG